MKVKNKFAIVAAIVAVVVALIYGNAEAVATAQWNIDRIDQRSLPLNKDVSLTLNGQGVTVYVVDSGILSTHEEFAGRIRAGFTKILDGRGTEDCYGHGTHVAGVIGGSTYGVAPNVTLVPVRVTNCSGSGWTSDMIAGIDWAIADHTAGEPAVMNISMSGNLSSKVNAAVDRAIADGIVVVTAAGNNNKDACSYSPGSTSSAINVAASDENDARWSWSNYGKCVDIFAPGANVLSAWATSATASKTLKGTSHATPHVAGVAALALQNNPALSVADVTSLIVSSATVDAISDAGTGSPNTLLYAPLSESSSVPVVTTTTTTTPATTTTTTVAKEIDDGAEVPSSTSVTVAVTKTSEGYEIAVESSLLGTKIQISALAKAKSSFTWTKTSSASGAVKFTTTRNLSGYNVIVLVSGVPYSAVAVG